MGRPIPWEVLQNRSWWRLLPGLSQRWHLCLKVVTPARLAPRLRAVLWIPNWPAPFADAHTTPTTPNPPLWTPNQRQESIHENGNGERTANTPSEWQLANGTNKSTKDPKWPKIERKIPPQSSANEHNQVKNYELTHLTQKRLGYGPLPLHFQNCGFKRRENLFKGKHFSKWLKCIIDNI